MYTVPVKCVEEDELVCERLAQPDLAVSQKDDGGQVEQDAEDGEQGGDVSPHDVGEGVDRVGPE